MRRVVGLKAALQAVNDVRSLDSREILTDGNGLYPVKLTPDEFAARVIADVRRDGDAAVRRITNALDGTIGTEDTPLEVPTERVRAAVDKISPAVRGALELAVKRVEAFQKAAMPKSWRDPSGDFGEEVRPLGRAGVYVPGGSAPLASSVVMTVVPARVAGVAEIILSTPGRAGQDPHPVVLAAAAIAGADRVFSIGGAQAIAAMAYGTESVPRVDIVCGPGNAFTTAAKKAVFGDVGVDGLYGPTETAVIADHSADPVFAAADLLAQAEHDVVALPVLITTSGAVADAIEAEVTRQLKGLPRTKIASAAVARGLSLVVDSVDEAVTVANALAPEHLCVSVTDATKYLPQIRFAGGIFLGEYSAEVMADYVAGPSHVMPTGGTARFASALSVRNFLRVSPFLNLSEKAFMELATDASELARAEGLDAHAAAADRRRRKLAGE
jgi:histidinol dehydrogenase